MAAFIVDALAEPSITRLKIEGEVGILWSSDSPREKNYKVLSLMNMMVTQYHQKKNWHIQYTLSLSMPMIEVLCGL